MIKTLAVITALGVFCTLASYSRTYAAPAAYSQHEVEAVNALIPTTPFYAKLGPDYERNFLKAWHPTPVSRQVARETAQVFWPGRF